MNKMCTKLKTFGQSLNVQEDDTQKIIPYPTFSNLSGKANQDFKSEAKEKKPSFVEILS